MMLLLSTDNLDVFCIYINEHFRRGTCTLVVGTEREMKFLPDAKYVLTIESDFVARGPYF